MIQDIYFRIKNIQWRISCQVKEIILRLGMRRSNVMDVVNELNVKDVENEQKYYRLAKIGFLGIDFVRLIVLHVFCHEFDLHLSFQQILQREILVT